MKLKKSKFCFQLSFYFQMVKIIRCKVFLEDQSMFLKNEQDNEIKIEAQKGLIENLRRQIDILKSCMQ